MYKEGLYGAFNAAGATQVRFRISGGWRPTVYYATSNSEDVLAVMRVPFPELRVLHF